MNISTKFHDFLFHTLNTKVYALLSVLPLKAAGNSKTFNYNILIRKVDLELIVKEIQKFEGLNSIQVFGTFHASKALLILKDNSEIVIDFMHKLVHKSLAFLNEEDILETRTITAKGVHKPKIEYLFEYTVLKNFLNYGALSKVEFEYFEDFHVLVKEDLLECFNIKYGTTFSNFYQLTNYDAGQRQFIIKNLNTDPTNGFLRKVNVRWHSFLGYMKQARII